MLDLDLVAHEAEPSITTDEDWEMSRDGVTVRTIDDAISVDDHGVHLELAWRSDLHLRSYTASAFLERVDTAGGFQVEAWYPEATRETGITQFAHEPTGDTPGAGRGMIVLRRR